MFAWADAAGLEGAVAARREHASPFRAGIPALALYSLPDALWQYAFAFVLFRLSRDAAPVERAAWSLIPIAIGIGLELGQLARVVEGVFDPADLALGVVAIALAWRTAAPPSL